MSSILTILKWLLPFIPPVLGFCTGGPVGSGTGIAIDIAVYLTITINK